eukprot:2439274-Rhodomonas_salina.1
MTHVYKGTRLHPFLLRTILILWYLVRGKRGRNVAETSKGGYELLVLVAVPRCTASSTILTTKPVPGVPVPIAGSIGRCHGAHLCLRAILNGGHTGVYLRRDHFDLKLDRRDPDSL